MSYNHHRPLRQEHFSFPNPNDRPNPVSHCNVCSDSLGLASLRSSYNFVRSNFASLTWQEIVVSLNQVETNMFVFCNVNAIHWCVNSASLSGTEKMCIPLFVLLGGVLWLWHYSNLATTMSSHKFPSKMCYTFRFPFGVCCSFSVQVGPHAPHPDLKI